jgi:hypothetical protein
VRALLLLLLLVLLLAPASDRTSWRVLRRHLRQA